MDIVCKIRSDPDFDAAPTMRLETLDEGRIDSIKITIYDKDIDVDWHDLADAVDMLGRVLGKGQGCIDREERL